MIINKIYPKVKYRRKDHQVDQLQPRGEIQFHTNQAQGHQIYHKIGKNRFLNKILKVLLVILVVGKIRLLRSTPIIKPMPL